MPDVFVSEKSKKPLKIKKNEIAHDIDKKNLRKQLQGHTHKLLGKKRESDNRPFSSFRFFPKKADFENKDPDEEVILLLRKHPITNISWIFMSFLMIVAPAIFSVMPILDQLPGNFKFITYAGWYLLTAAYVFEKFLGWYFNVNIITDERIFDVDFVNLVYREITDANIDQVQDVTVEVGSAIRTIFNYGNVFVQTAAQIPQVEFEAVPYPDRVARILRELRIEEEIEKLEGRLS